jgi:hypothetical protein
MNKSIPFTSTFSIGAWARVPDRFVGHGCGRVLGGVGGFFCRRKEVSIKAQKKNR